MAEFVKGLKLAQGFFEDLVEPVITQAAPNLEYSAGLIGSGSEVFGFDTARSVDHDWGPRVMVFLEEATFTGEKDRLVDELAQRLPVSYRGFPTHFTAPDPTDNGTQLAVEIAAGPVNHRVEFLVLSRYLERRLQFDIAGPLSTDDWLRFPSQRLRSVVAGALFRDDLDVQSVRDRFVWYPHDVWLCIMASFWTRVGQEEHLAGRASEVGDDIGSRLITARLVRDIMRLTFLIDRQYAPYPKWFGTAFSQLPSSPGLVEPLERALAADRWPAREAALCDAYQCLAKLHNGLGVTERLEPNVRPFFGRPFLVIGGDRFSEALCSKITNVDLRRIARFGSIDCLSDNTDLLERPSEVARWSRSE